MDQGWQPYQDPLMGRPAQFTTGLASHPQHTASHRSRHSPPVGYTYETFQTPGTTSKPPSSGPNSKTVSMASSPTATPRSRDYVTDADTTMEDADPYNRAKYPSRPNHHNRPSSQFLGQAEESSAARRYSPMNALSLPTSSYPTSPGKAQGSYGFPPNGSWSVATIAYPGARLCLAAARLSVAAIAYVLSARREPPPTGPLDFPRSRRPTSAWINIIPPSTSSHMSPAFGHGTRSPRSGSLPSQVPGRGPVPKFQNVKSVQELQPRVHTQPAYRRADPEGGFISPLQALTSHLPSTYRICNPNFNYESSRNPRRVLTKPSKGVKNDGYDNEDSDYILYVNDILGSEEAGHKNRYLILDVLGQGTFGQVVKCQNLKTQEVVAVKVIKNKTAYFNQSMMEVSVLDLLNSKYDKNDDHHLLRLKDTFIHRQHLCLAFELLSVNLYELIKQNQFRGLSTTLVRVFAQQLLNALSLLNKAHLIHCDLKPENILLKNLESPIIKVIDFGSACDERQTVYTYIQSRFYRSPEVLLGLPYSSAIDMWSLGCIVVELFLGLPLFPGSSEYNQVTRIVEMLGLPQQWMLDMGKQSGEFFEKTHDEYGRKTHRLKSLEQYSREHNTKEQPSKKYFNASTLEEIIRSYPMPRKNMKPAEVERELNNRVAFIDFVRGLLAINPLERWSPQQAKLHPFITQQKFTGPFMPPGNLKYSAPNKTVAPGVQQQQQAEAASKQRAAQAAQAQQSAYNMQMNQQYHAPAQPQQAPPAMYNGISSSTLPDAATGLRLPDEHGSWAVFKPKQPLEPVANAHRQWIPMVEAFRPQSSGWPATWTPMPPFDCNPAPHTTPPPPDGYVDPNNANQRRRGSRTGGSGNQRNRDFVRTLEDGVLSEGYMAQNQWH
ncbi:hypothetical protein N7481_013197 [Penicillium waksmanii]|uniref:uncharacterized protein n=1 Tax=Penicillium waksmanii TaxID=69791 RepID=UPI0025499940|nr:uncharacterized protein N7481_013197 [Penicillium waksmanii]KAJ5966483.1 hypothetical protein N7481_013197 [Penicillium waksmanii]